MTQQFLESDLFAAFARLGKRLRLKSGSAGLTNPRVENTVVPITSIDDLLATQFVADTTLSVAGGSAGNNGALTVSTGKRWTVLALNIYRASGDNTIDELRISDAQGDYFTLVTQSAASSLQIRLEQPVILGEGQHIVPWFTGAGSSTTSMQVDVWVSEEDAY